MHTRARALALALCVALVGCAAQSSQPATAWYTGQDGVPPRADRIYVCHSFGCARKTPVQLTGRDLRRLGDILRAGRASPQAERAAIARAVAWMETRVAATVGSAGDRPGFDMRGAGEPGQMDCIDEATNTTSLLLLAEARGLLRHHRAGAPVARGFLVDGRYPHATAVVLETSGDAYAVDSWPTPNGAAPVIQPLSAWFAARPRL
ncbi:hypothetical protein [Pannonibacter tanglangensis]|uniref:Lipoprotein n=1 Tax=Pannonibacter tanglangensis TaxID=2750084 RepID=A0ABW9ZBL4_9HYPH|nr:hypothetical protein [Pannonibacter sp. XCT-34]NBN62210.1 hypothetical protein [Pannonibacter sp. XCT-34]